MRVRTRIILGAATWMVLKRFVRVGTRTTHWVLIGCSDLRVAVKNNARRSRISLYSPYFCKNE